ncbi:bestrophin [Holotrichia oblita]|uniref:Bestrophin n=1 Tax=Holotrichia oblita TaxID=644536 RepID=A0ACB9TBA5_HOLOL|nr:bestrophin [Holotrichia oblita]
MTVTYTAEVATCTKLGCFLKLLRRWKGSIYKLVWIDLSIFLFAYYCLSSVYHLALNDESKKIFEEIVQYCKDYSDLIPLSFVLGFYVSIVMTRWWNQYTSIPWPDTIAVFVSATIHGQDERGRVMRRTVMRYVCLCITMMFTMISPRVKKRFPTLDHFVEAGLLQVSERDIISDLNLKFPKYSKHWMPIVWASSIITRARKEGRIRDDFAVKTIIDELNKLRGQCGLLLSYDTISIPLVYTQVAESLINPFGDDDDDFEVNWMVDRNLQVSYLIVDEMHHAHPELVRDQYWDEVFPQELPYTLASEPFREQHPLPSTANIAVMPQTADFAIPTGVKIDDMQFMNDMNSGIMFTARPSAAQLKRGMSQVSNPGASVPDSISRVNSVTNVLKKLFTKDDNRDPKLEKDSPIELVAPAPTPNKMTSGGSSSSLPSQIRTQPNTMRITDQVIEEVDEQLTITSQKNANEPRPSVMNIFSPPPPSDPISVPQSRNRNMPNGGFSRSAPSESQASPNDALDNISIGSVTDSESDEFEKLKAKRQQEMRSRMILNLTRSTSSNVGDCPSETELLLSKVSPTTIVNAEQLQSTRRSGPDEMDIFGYNKNSPESDYRKKLN